MRAGTSLRLLLSTTVPGQTSFRLAMGDGYERLRSQLDAMKVGLLNNETSIGKQPWWK